MSTLAIPLGHVAVFEIHASVDLKSAHDEMLWHWWCKDREYHRIRTLNARGDTPVQNMVSVFVGRRSVTEAVGFANKLAAEIRDGGFDVCRCKVEIMMTAVPKDTVVEGQDLGHYWEFHIKMKVYTPGELLGLEQALGEVPRPSASYTLGLSMSAHSKFGLPIVTLRGYNCDRVCFCNWKEEAMSTLSNKGFHPDDKIQAELSVYDTNPDLDRGWLN